MKRAKRKRKKGTARTQCLRKQAFDDAKAAHVARRGLEARGEDGLRVYLCPHCDRWHVGHGRRKGRKSRLGK